MCTQIRTTHLPDTRQEVLQLEPPCLVQVYSCIIWYHFGDGDVSGRMIYKSVVDKPAINWTDLAYGSEPSITTIRKFSMRSVGYSLTAEGRHKVNLH